MVSQHRTIFELRILREYMHVLTAVRTDSNPDAEHVFTSFSTLVPAIAMHVEFSVYIIRI